MRWLRSRHPHVNSIGLGANFIGALNGALSSSQVLIAVIGRAWLSASDGSGVLRLQNPDDYVRLEIEGALARGLFVIPVLVDGASMPQPESLPPTMAALCRYNGCEVSNARFGSDTTKLINTLRRIVADEKPDGRGEVWGAGSTDDYRSN